MSTAFPAIAPDGGFGTDDDFGLTKREYAAIQIMAALLSNDSGQTLRESQAAELAVIYTDALFLKLNVD